MFAAELPSWMGDLAGCCRWIYPFWGPMWGISDGDGEKLLIHLAAYPPVHDRHVHRELSQNSSKYFKLSPIISKIRNVFILVPSTSPIRMIFGWKKLSARRCGRRRSFGLRWRSNASGVGARLGMGESFLVREDVGVIPWEWRLIYMEYTWLIMVDSWCNDITDIYIYIYILVDFSSSCI